LLYINDEKNVIVANYSGGNIAFGKNNDGSIGESNKWFSIMEGVMLKDKRATRSYGSFSQTESLCCLMIWE
jgi:hypothetical protein